MERYRLHRNWMGAHCHVRTFEGHTEGVSCVQFDDHRIVSGSHDNTIKVTYLEHGILLYSAVIEMMLYFSERKAFMCTIYCLYNIIGKEICWLLFLSPLGMEYAN